MGYSEGPHDNPADLKDRLTRVGTKYQSSAPAVADGDNVYFLVDSAGRIISTAQLGGFAETGTPATVADGATVQAHFDEYGRLAVFLCEDGNATPVGVITPNTVQSASLQTLAVTGFNYIRRPDGNWDEAGAAANSGPGIDAAKVAVIGGDIALRASAVAGEVSGTSTAVDNLGWAKSFNAVLDVTAVPSGGTPTLDLYIQTQMPNGDWQDLAHFTQVGGSTTKEMMAWGPADGNIAGIGAEGAAATFDRFFTNEDASLAAANIRLLPLGDSMRVKWVFAAGGSTGDYTFSVDVSAHS